MDLGLIYKLCRLNDAPLRIASPPRASAKRHLTIVVAIAVMAGFRRESALDCAVVMIPLVGCFSRHWLSQQVQRGLQK